MDIKLSDREIIEQYCLGKDEAIGLLFLRYNSLFMVTSKKYFCNTQCAEDVVQDVLLKFLSYRIEKRVELFSNIRSIKAFIYTAVKYMALDRIRKKKLVVTDLSDINFPEDASDIYNNLNLDYSAVGLTKKESIYFTEFLNEMSLDSISEKYGVTKSTVKNTIQNAKRKIIHHYRNSQLVS